MALAINEQFKQINVTGQLQSCQWYVSTRAVNAMGVPWLPAEYIHYFQTLIITRISMCVCDQHSEGEPFSN